MKQEKAGVTNRIFDSLIKDFQKEGLTKDINQDR